jgi:hypothetical protein
MAIPDTNNFTFYDVANELYGDTNAGRNLSQCFTDSIDNSFDDNHKTNSEGTKNNLLNFRNYGGTSTCTFNSNFIRYVGAPLINVNTNIVIYFDDSGSMDGALPGLQDMKNNLLKDALLHYYDNDGDAYDNKVSIVVKSDERTFQWLQLEGASAPSGNLIVLVFQDESLPDYHDSDFDENEDRTTDYDSDLSSFRSQLTSYYNISPEYYRGVIFQVTGSYDFFYFLQAVESGSGNYSGTNGLSDKVELSYKYSVSDGETGQYYLDKVLDALNELNITT